MKDIPQYKINNIRRDEFGRPSGIVAINKPVDSSSHDLVDQIRKHLNIRKVGHIGALDIFADGVMIYLIGKDTKLSNKLVNLDKEYITTIILGIATNTQDTEGEVVEVKTGYKIKDFPKAKQVLKSFVGSQKQYVSIYSSVKINGKKLRILMRNESYNKQIIIDEKNNKKVNFIPKKEYTHLKPFSVHIPAKEITIYAIELLEKGDIPIHKMLKFKNYLKPWPDNQTFPYLKIKVRCSKGTYIRQLAEDIGNQFNMPAMLLSLTRTRVGDISLENCINIQDI